MRGRLKEEGLVDTAKQIEEAWLSNDERRDWLGRMVWMCIDALSYRHGSEILNTDKINEITKVLTENAVPSMDAKEIVDELPEHSVLEAEFSRLSHCHPAFEGLEDAFKRGGTEALIAYYIIADMADKRRKPSRRATSGIEREINE